MSSDQIPMIVSSTSTFSSTQVPTTPMPLHRNDDSLSSFFRQNGFSPPKNSEGRKTSETIDVVNGWLQLIGFSWVGFEPSEQVKMSFLVLKEQLNILLNYKDCIQVAHRLVEALDSSTREGRNLEAFVRPGGDKTGDLDARQAARYLDDFYRKHPGWESWENSPTIFNQPDDLKRVEPVVRFQTEESAVSYIVSAANCILYCMRLQTGTSREEAVLRYSINVGRFMRNNFTNEEVFRAIFGMGGGYPVDILEKLLQHCHAKEPTEGKTDTFELRPRTRPFVTFEMIKDYLIDLGPLLVESFKTFPYYMDKNNSVFTGDWDQWKDTKKDDNRHAFLIVGVRMNGDSVEFLVQDSYPDRPFIIVGWDLLISMGITKFTYIKEGVTYAGTSLDHSLDNIASVLTSGSPGPGVPSEVLFDENTAQIATNESNDSAQAPLSAGASTTCARPDWWGLDIPEGVDVIWT